MTNSNRLEQSKTFFWLAVGILVATLLLLNYGWRGKFSPTETGDLQQVFIETDTITHPVTETVIDWDAAKTEGELSSELTLSIPTKQDTIGTEKMIRFRFYTMDQFGQFHYTGFQHTKPHSE